IRFLRRIPVDPMTGQADWGLRSVQDDPDSTSWGGNNVFDVYSKSTGTALDGTKYSDCETVQEREGMNRQSGRVWRKRQGEGVACSQRGFTLLEMMIVISIILILVGIAAG